MKENTTKTTTTKKATTEKQLPKAVMNKSQTTAIEKKLAERKRHLDLKAKTIRKEMANVEKAFIRIGYELHELSCIYNADAFKEIGYTNIYDYANKEFNIARGTCSDFINVIEQFGKRDENGMLLPELDDKYKNFSSSKLSVMITMNDNELEQVKEDMTVKAIKALKKGAKSEKTADKAPEEAPDDIVIEDDNYEVSNVVISFRTVEEYNANIDKLDSLILRCLKAGHTVNISETVPKVRTSEQKEV